MKQGADAELEAIAQGAEALRLVFDVHGKEYNKLAMSIIEAMMERGPMAKVAGTALAGFMKQHGMV
jgi:hypothetical protein